jgi:hypothetical protein
MTSEHFEDFVGSLTPEQVDSLREALLNKSDEKQEEPAEPVDNVGEDFTVNRNSASNGKIPVQARENTWSDVGEDSHIETPEFEKTPRNRPKPKTKSIQCHICSKTFHIAASLVYGEYYRCDRCIGR